jgi:hypothetical protein
MAQCRSAEVGRNTNPYLEAVEMDGVFILLNE